MRILTDKENLQSQCDRSYIFIDNDFLGQLFEHEEVLKDFVGLLPNSILIIDPYVELEFRRDVYLPKQRSLKKEFINSSLFEPVMDHQEIYKKVQENALLLSQIYAHQKENGASLVDLILAGRLMLTPYASFIITGNRKDFPNCIFDNISILNLENQNGTVQPFYVIQFNSGKFTQCYKALEKIPI